jgi:hypothetical protein
VDAGEAAVAEEEAAVVAVVVSMFPHNPFDFYANYFQHGPEVIMTRFATLVGKASTRSMAPTRLSGSTRDTAQRC